MINYKSFFNLLSKDMWADSNDLPSTRTSVAGFAPIGGVCYSASKYSVVEEWGGFQNIQVISHEMGHKFYLLYYLNFQSGEYLKFNLF